MPATSTDFGVHMEVMRLGATLVVMLGVGVQYEDPDERLYGRVSTASGEVLEGFLSWDRDNQADPPQVTSGIRFGHLAALVVLDDLRARLELKSGEMIDLRSSSGRARGVPA